jgi:hypothetical protein
MSETTNKAAPTTDVGSAAATKSFMHWPEAVIALGLWLAVAWVCVLAFGLVKVRELSI